MRSLVYFNPRRNPLATRELFSEFDSFFNDLAYPQFAPLGQEKPGLSSTSVEETEKAFLLSVDLPGVLPSDIKLDVSKDKLEIQAERKKEFRTENGTEKRTVGQYSHSFTLPEDVNGDEIEAHFENGVLTLALPKEIKAQKKTISIQHGQENKGLLERWFSKPDSASEKKIN
ncbi:MAG: Hsp20/alpha crystallin family protein [Pseudobdellovibrionaceae bacterium]